METDGCRVILHPGFNVINAEFDGMKKRRRESPDN